MKNLLIKTFALTTALTGVAYAVPTPFQGFYTTLGIGAMNSRMNFSQTQQIALTTGATTPVINSSTFNDNDTANTEAFGSLSIGYIFPISSSFVIGAELNADVENSKLSSTTSTNIPYIDFSSTVTTKLNNSLAVLLKPGFLFNQGNTLVYGLVGPRWGDFETTSTTQANQSSSSPYAINGANYNKHSSYNLGLALGGGVQQYIGSGFSVGLEYQYTDYDKISLPTASGNLTAFNSNVAIGNVNTMNSIKAHTNSLAFDVTYHFGATHSLT